MDKILRNTNIWDLHIHTPLGTPTKKNYENASTEEFIDTIIDIYNKSNNKIGMISFTDHNKINADAYELFKIKSDIAIIPGIEVDVYLSEKDKDSKHIIFYFDEEELENIRELKTLVEDYIESNEKVIFEDFIMYLVVKRKHFAVSPHAFKQGKRGIDNDWFDEERASRGANEFTGLIFPFWEAAGKTDICKAIEFLNEQYNDEYNNQSVIAFSDSADYKKLQNYINNPHQYFRCLNSFKGLLLAGSDPDRIIYENENRPLYNPSEKIKSIRLSNDLREIKKNNVIEIEFSDRLNAIVGGRGKGKSALLDAIVYDLNENEIENRIRRDFVKKFHVEITNFNDGLMPSDEQLVTLKKYADKKVNLINSDIRWIPETYTIYNREYPWSSGSKSIEELQWENIKVETGEMKSIIETVEEPQFSYAEILQKKYLGEFDEDKKWDELGTALDEKISIPVVCKKYTREEPMTVGLGRVLNSCQDLIWEEEFDASKEETISVSHPCAEIIKVLGLSQKKYDGYYCNKAGELIAFDTALTKQKAGLIIRKDALDEFLSIKNFHLVWFVNASKEIHDESLMIKKYTDWTGLLEYKGDFVEGEYYITEYR